MRASSHWASSQNSSTTGGSASRGADAAVASHRLRHHPCNAVMACVLSRRMEDDNPPRSRFGLPRLLSLDELGSPKRERGGGSSFILSKRPEYTPARAREPTAAVPERQGGQFSLVWRNRAERGAYAPCCRER